MFGFSGIGAKQLEQLPPHAVSVAAYIRIRVATLAPNISRNVRIQLPCNAVESYEITIPYFAQWATAEALRCHVNRRRHGPGSTGHPSVRNQRNLESLALQ